MKTVTRFDKRNSSKNHLSSQIGEASKFSKIIQGLSIAPIIPYNFCSIPFRKNAEGKRTFLTV